MSKNKNNKFNPNAAFETIMGVSEDGDNEVEEKRKTRGRPKKMEETKKRFGFSMLPSVHIALGKVAFVKRISMSDILDEALRDYLSNHVDLIEEYDKIKK